MDVLIFDEAHHVVAVEYRKIWDSVTKADTVKLCLGLSATPTRTKRSEVDDLRAAFNKRLFLPESLGTNATKELIEKGVLAKPKFRLIQDVPKFERWKGASDRRSLKSLVQSPERWKATVECIDASTSGKTVVYTLSRVHGKALVRHLRHRGASAEYLDGQTPYGERIAVLERFRSGETRVLVNVSLLIEGVDCPAAESVVLTYPVNSDIVFQQMVGRVLRGPAIGGTEECEVWGAEGSQEQLDRRLFGGALSLAGWEIDYLA